MSDFIRHESLLQKIPSILVERVLGFSGSPEYKKMRSYELDIPGVVGATFGTYLARLHKEDLLRPNEPNIEQAIASAHETLEELASSRETAVRSLITDEVFESVERGMKVSESFKRHLGSNALELYKQWADQIR